MMPSNQGRGLGAKQTKRRTRTCPVPTHWPGLWATGRRTLAWCLSLGGVPKRRESGGLTGRSEWSLAAHGTRSPNETCWIDFEIHPPKQSTPCQVKESRRSMGPRTHFSSFGSHRQPSSTLQVCPLPAPPRHSSPPPPPTPPTPNSNKQARVPCPPALHPHPRHRPASSKATAGRPKRRHASQAGTSLPPSRQGPPSPPCGWKPKATASTSSRRWTGSAKVGGWVGG